MNPWELLWLIIGWGMLALVSTLFILAAIGLARALYNRSDRGRRRKKGDLK